MDLQGFEKIATNCDILIEVYKRLDLEDQLRLAQVSHTLATVFENFIWTKSYRTLTIYESDTDYVVTNETDVGRVLLTPNGIREFIRFYAEKVQVLNTHCFLDVGICKNLTSLRFVGNCFGTGLMQAVAENLPHLEQLQLQLYIPPYYIDDYASHEAIVLDAKIVSRLLQMNNLKRLCLDRTFKSIKVKHFYEIVTKLNLQVLKLNFLIVPEQDEFGILTNPVHLNELDITTTCDPWTLSSNGFETFRNILQNLSILTIQLAAAEVTGEILANMAGICQNLQKLTLRQTDFVDIQLFPTPSKLNELHIERCYGLTLNNLRQILTETKISKFISTYTYYDGASEDFRISPLIETLTVDTLDMSEFTSFYEENDNLKALKWSNCEEIENVPNMVVGGVPLASCRNLETLKMDVRYMTLDTLLQLRHLHTLTMHLSLPQQWPYLTTLLSHPALAELTLTIISARTASFYGPLQGFTTNVTRLNIYCFDHLESSLDFWLDLFCQNTKMALSIIPWEQYEAIRKLIYHRKFPKRLRTIEICGFNINCAALRRNFDGTVSNIARVRNEFGRDYGHDIKCGVTICRNL